MSRSTTVNENGFTPFANGRCQGLYHSVNENGFTNGECQSLHVVDENGFTLFDNGGYQSLNVTLR